MIRMFAALAAIAPFGAVAATVSLDLGRSVDILQVGLVEKFQIPR